ncbi:MAG: transposase [Patescibacteria group bacterium]
MQHPEWVMKHKAKGTEIRKLGKHYYLYKIRSEYDKEKKRAKKITEKFLGKITEEGLIKPKHERIIESQKNISVKEFGASQFIAKESKDLIQNLKEVFPDTWKEIFTFAVFRFFSSSPLKNIRYHYQSSYLSEIILDAKVSPKSLSNMLHTMGQQRALIKKFLSKYIAQDECMAVDLTHIFSLSENVISATLGRNSEQNYLPQINLFLLFSLDRVQPIFYRLVPGSIRDVSSLLLSMEESKMKDIILVGDKGFYSADNVKELETKKIRYILPLKRNSQFIDYSPLMQAGKKQFGGHFLFENRVIWYYEHAVDGKKIVTFLDERLKVEEERDFLVRVNDGMLKIEEFHENESKFGTISIVTKTDLSPQRIFELLKSRVEIEVTFDTFKNVLNADRSYMRDDSAMEGWMFVNFVALLLYYKVYGLLMSRDFLSRCSPKDVILHLSRVFNVKIGDNWVVSEIPKKTRLLIEKLGIELSIT